MYIITPCAMEQRISVDITITSEKKLYYFINREKFYTHKTSYQLHAVILIKADIGNGIATTIANVILVRAIMVMQRQTTSRKPYICATLYLRKMSCNGNLSVSHNMKKKNCTFSLKKMSTHLFISWNTLAVLYRTVTLSAFHGCFTSSLVSCPQPF